MITSLPIPATIQADLALSRSDNRFVFKTDMKSYSVTAAKPILGKLADKALRHEPIFIRRRQRLLQLVEAVVPEPIPSLPEGHFAITPERAAFLNSTPVDPRPLDR